MQKLRCTGPCRPSTVRAHALLAEVHALTGRDLQLSTCGMSSQCNDKILLLQTQYTLSVMTGCLHQLVLTQNDHCSQNAVIGYQRRGPYIKIVLTSSVLTTRVYCDNSDQQTQWTLHEKPENE